MKTILVVGVLIALAWIGLIVTQVMMPIIQGMPLFPILRTRNRQVAHDLTEVRGEIDLAETERQTERLKKKLTKRSKA